MQQGSTYITPCEMVSVICGCSTFRGEPGLTVFLLEFFFGGGDIKFSIPEKIQSEARAAVFEAACLKNSLPLL